MEVNLIDYTIGAIDKLLYTKSTRLTLGQTTRDKIFKMHNEDKMRELEYMAKTIPSSWEFVNYTFEILGVSRAFTHQFVRTRTGSFAQQSMRTLNVGHFNYITGPSIKGNPKLQDQYDQCMRWIQNTYDSLIANGAAVEDARGILPTNIETNIIAQFNLRSLADLYRKRSSQRVQPEYRDVVSRMITEVMTIHPWAEFFLIPDRLCYIQELEAMISKEIMDEAQKLKYYKLCDLLKN